MTFSTTIRNADIRWAKIGIRYDANSGVTATHYVQDSLFEQITGTGNCGIYANVPSGTISLSNLKKCNVTTPVNDVAGYVSGTMTDSPFCTDKAFTGLRSTDFFTFQSPPDTQGAVGPSYFVELVR